MDHIAVWAGGATNTRYVVDVNAVRTSFPRTAVQRIRILGGKGDDLIQIGTRKNPFMRALVTINGGGGHNRLLRYDLLRAQAGDGNAKAAVSPDPPATPPSPPPADTTPPPAPASEAEAPAAIIPTRTDPPGTNQPAVPSGDKAATGGQLSAGDVTPPTTQSDPFVMYDGTAFTNKPDMQTLGFSDIYISSKDIYSGTYPNFDFSKPDEAATRSLARRVAAAGVPLVLDCEQWQVDQRVASSSEVDKNLAMLMQIVDWIHSERPQVKVGFYGILPLADFWTPVNYLYFLPYVATSPWAADNVPKFEAAYKDWQAANDRLRPLAAKVDFVCPSLYTFYDDPTNWQLFAQANIAKAHRYGKPVVPFIWMQYHDAAGDGLALQYIDQSFWRQQVQLVHDSADGVVIWSGGAIDSKGNWYVPPWASNPPWLDAVEQVVVQGL